MTPAVPYNLFDSNPKKRSATTQSEISETQGPVVGEQSHTVDSQIAVPTAESSPSSSLSSVTSEDIREGASPHFETKTEKSLSVASSQDSQQNISASPNAEFAQASPYLSSLSIRTAKSERTKSPPQDTSISHKNPTVSAQAPARSQGQTEAAESTTTRELSTSHIDPDILAPGSVQAEIDVAKSASSQETSISPTHTTVSAPAADPAHAQASPSDPLEETTLPHAHPPVVASVSGLAEAPAQRLIQFDTYEWPCFDQECRKLTTPYDGSTVICPRCGPYSEVRYCGKKCLFNDVLTHWGLDCGQFTLNQKADPLTLEPRQVNIQPFIPSLTHIDCPEHHRQLVRHSLDNTGDYFIFSDFMQWRADGYPGTWPAHKHASGSVVATVNFNFTDDGSSVPARHVFTRLLHVCFLVGGQRANMTYCLFRMILGRLIELGLDTQNNRQSLVWQFRFEFGFEGTFADLLTDDSPVAWSLVAGQILQLERQYGSFLSGWAGLGTEWTNAI